MKTLNFQSFVLVLTSFILGFSEFIIVGILNNIAADFHVSVATVGLLVTIFAIIYAIATPLVSMSVGHNRLYWSYFVLMLIFTCSNLLTALATNYYLLIAGRILTAIVSGTLVSVSITFVSFLAPVTKRAGIVAWIFSGFSIASVFGVPLGTWLSNYTSWRYVFIIISILAVVTLLLAMFCLPYDLRQQHVNSFFKQLTIFLDHQIQLGILLPLLNLAGIYVFYTYLRPIFSQGMGFSNNAMTVLLFVYGFMSLIGNLYSGRIAAEHGLKTMPIVFLAQFILLGSLSFVISNRIFGLFTVMLLGVSMYLLNSPSAMFYLQVAEEKYPQSLVLASSFNSIFANFGIALGSGIGSLLYAKVGLTGIGPGGAVFALLAMLVNLWLIQLQKRQKLQKKTAG
ncbi:MFS transporter [Liquorilactobacillus sicerae]|uniref:MFS transporter n=1 Tax=Liquorilactobacillus sicerae TaxID=1416943 RepID=UPI0024809B68|nr:MFS transporter [Liquorilactobacillus sicerae]